MSASIVPPGCSSSWEQTIDAALRSAVLRCPRRYDGGGDDEDTAGEDDQPRRCGSYGYWLDTPTTAPSDTASVPDRRYGLRAASDAGRDTVEHASPGLTWRCQRGHLTRHPRVGQIRGRKDCSWRGHGAIPSATNTTEDQMLDYIDAVRRSGGTVGVA